MKDLIVVRGGGDLASGTIYRLCKSGYPVLVLETKEPTAIRRQVSFCEAVYKGTWQVEDMTCHLAGSEKEAIEILKSQPDHKREPVMLVDPKGKSIGSLKPKILVDGILAKKNLGTSSHMAQLVVALGPGFTAGVDCHCVIETKRGHNLGRIIWEGSAIENTGIPGNIGGYSQERVIHGPIAGRLETKAAIGDILEKNQIIAQIHTDGKSIPVVTIIPGVLRGILPDGMWIPEGMKLADVDPRISEKENCSTISDKARCIAGSVLEVVTAYDRYGRAD